VSGRDERPVTQVGQAHPELDQHTSERVAGALAGIAEGYGVDVKTVVAETVRAENSSAAGNDVTP